MKKVFLAPSLLALMVSALTFTSCSKRIIPQTEGYVQLTVNNPEVEIVTKAVETVDDSYKVEVKQGETVVKDGTYAFLKNQFSLVPGDYSISAYNMTAAECLTQRKGRGVQHFYGSTTFTIQAGIVTPVSFTCEMQNCRVSLTLDDTFKSVFKEEESIIKVYEDSDPTRVMTFPHTATLDDEDLWAYFNIDDTPKLMVVIEVTRNDGAKGNYTMEVIPEAKTWHKLSIKSNSTNGQADVEVLVDDSLTEKDEVQGVDPY